MVSRMTYFRIKWRELPAAYARFLAAHLAPGAPVVLVEDGSTWPVVRWGSGTCSSPAPRAGWTRRPTSTGRTPHARTPRPPRPSGARTRR